MAVDEPQIDEALETLREILHAVLYRLLDVVGDHVILLLQHIFPDQHVDEHDLYDRHAAHAGLDRLEQFLGHDPLHVEGDGTADGGMLLLRKQVEDAADAARRAGGMDRAEHEVARFSRVDRRLERLHVSKLAHEDDVWVLADGMLHADLEVPHVVADLTLVDQALVLGEDEFDRILKGEDVLAVVSVDVVEHRPDRRALAGARHAREQHHALVELAEPLDRGRQEELLEIGDRVVDAAGHEAPGALLREHVDAEPPPHAINDTGVREVGAAVGVEDAPLPRVHDRRTEPFHLLGVNRRILQRLKRALHPHVGRLVDLEVQVAAVELDHGLEQPVDLQAGRLDRHGWRRGRGNWSRLWSRGQRATG